MSEHTPGPWRIGNKRTGHLGIGISHSQPERGLISGQIANVYYIRIASKGTPFDDPENAEAVANARLIAAAPKMLQALLACVENMTRALECGDRGDWETAEIFINNQRGIAEEAIKAAEEGQDDSDA